jgi:hypothetical protein
MQLTLAQCFHIKMSFAKKGYLAKKIFYPFLITLEIILQIISSSFNGKVKYKGKHTILEAILSDIGIDSYATIFENVFTDG